MEARKLKGKIKMEIAYLIAGKRFRAKDEASLNKELSKYNLIADTNNWTARRLSDKETIRYRMVQSFGDSADINGLDVCIGKLIEKDERNEVIETDISELEKILEEVKQDIPDAKILGGSYWI